MTAKPPPAWMIRVNTALLGRGLRVGSQHVLTVPGRISGEPRSTPISEAVVDGERYLVAAFRDAAWVANVRAAGHGTLQRRGETVSVRLAEVPVAERGPILRAFLDQVRSGVRFFGSQSGDEIIARADRYPVFRVS